MNQLYCTSDAIILEEIQQCKPSNSKAEEDINFVMCFDIMDTS